jgi:hypothetical protein
MLPQRNAGFRWAIPLDGHPEATFAMVQIQFVAATIGESDMLEMRSVKISHPQ